MFEPHEKMRINICLQDLVWCSLSKLFPQHSLQYTSTVACALQVEASYDIILPKANAPQLGTKGSMKGEILLPSRMLALRASGTSNQ